MTAVTAPIRAQNIMPLPPFSSVAPVHATIIRPPSIPAYTNRTTFTYVNAQNRRADCRGKTRRQIDISWTGGQQNGRAVTFGLTRN